MKNTIKLVILSCFFLLAGCVPSLNSLCTEQDLIFDPALLGTWTDEDSAETWVFTYADEKEYKLVYTDEKGLTGEFKAHLIKLDGKIFLELTPTRPALTQNDFFKGHFLTLHTFVQITQTSPTVEISFLKPEFLKSVIAKNPSAIRHEKIGDDILITASTKELQTFLLAHLKTEGAFAPPISVKRKGRNK